ncbi:peptide deformylase [Fervidicella metallireducens AeB]|uniref:Peptide deformylase n=1 Tax=Fervidicella metallireducens AeB TaxID=1403537 RepID=A0A017RUN7_9CLOT|nr:peptide deformylase [Fervidicella metallireducens]EYE88336.1 peptide deformylase [Fervidicella metallireducens AeB]
MAVREIVQKGHPALSKISEPVKDIDDSILSLVQDLKDTLYAGTGIGLAAPQIAVNKRVILIDLRDGMEPIVLINPKIVAKTGKQESEEGCLSYPGYYGFLERPKKVVVRGLNVEGQEVEYKGEELLCRAFCHEIDHLDGIMFTDKAYELYKEE